MSKNLETLKPKTIDVLKLGEIIPLDSSSELADHEDSIALGIHDDMTPRQIAEWGSRTSLINLIAPPKFHDEIENIKIQKILNPQDSLYSANERGLTFSMGLPRKCTTDLAQDAARRTQGFVITADAISTGRGIVGEFSTEVWLIPTPGFRSKDYSMQGIQSNASGPFRRYIAMSDEVKKEFRQFANAKRQVGAAALNQGTLTQSKSGGIKYRKR